MLNNAFKLGDEALYEILACILFLFAVSILYILYAHQLW